MTATKLPVGRALLFKIESAYNGGGSLSTSTDGVLVCDAMEPTHEYAHDGRRRQPPGMAGHMRGVAPAGPRLTLTVPHEFKGAGAAYSASVFPSLHRLLLAAGFDGAGSFSGGSEKWDYTPTPIGTTPSSALAEIYGRGQKYPVQGIYLNLERVEWGDGGLPLWSFLLKGLRGAVADVALPSVTYPALSIEGPKAIGSSLLTFGSWSTNAIVKGGSFAMNRETFWRANQNATSGDAGLSVGRRGPVLELLVESTSLVGSPYHTSAGLDPYLLYEAATEITGQVQFGSTQYNRLKLIPGKLQLMAPPVEEVVDGSACWRLTCACNPSTINGNDDITIRTD